MNLYDDVTASQIPPSAEAVAGYVDGRYAWTDADWALFPNAAHLRIAVFASTQDGDCLDVETYDATPDQAPGWVALRRSNGVDPWVYMNESTWGAVVQAFDDQNVPHPHYWVASWGPAPGQGSIPPNPPTSGTHTAVAVQYDHDLPYDISYVYDTSALPGGPPPPPSPPLPPPPPPVDPVETAIMTLPELRQGSTGHFVVKLQGLLNAWGYGLHQDGGFGPLTNNCVRAFQADHGLVVDGIVGQHTWSHLIAD